MNNLPMTLQLDNQFKRQYNLLQFIRTHQNKNLTLSDLSQELGTSKPTLRKDIDIINSSLPTNDFQLTYNDQGFLQITQQEISVDSVITRLAKDTTIYRMMDLLLHDKAYTTEELSEHLMISRSSIFNIIRHMNEVLKEYRVSIATGPLTFIGKEEDIRFLLFSFYSSFGDSQIIDSDSNHHAQTIIEHGRKSGITFLHFSHFRFTLWLSIAKVRGQAKKFCYLKESTAELVKKNRGYQVIEPLIALYYSSLFKLAIPESESLWLYLAFLHCVSYSKWQGLDEERVYAFRREESAPVVAAVHRFLLQVFPKQMLDDGSLEKMEAFLINTRLLSNMSTSYEMTSVALIDLMKEKYPEIYQLWFRQLERLKANPLFEFTHLDHLAASLTTFHATILRIKSQQPLRVIVALQSCPSMDDYIIQEAELLFLRQISVKFLIEQPVTIKEINDHQASLIICNYDLHLNEDLPCPIHRLPNIPSKEDWTLLMDKITYLNSATSTANNTGYF
ncbi:hypothetical protein IGL24_001047 [Enterococcus sp. DIV2371]|uniref:helix-turn-helix domain-containing protein n=1 Tax=Enterococcus sp. DIV2371 TaxID=2774927 RepID=UPI003D27D7AC